MIPVALDAMGGDHAPDVTVAGAVRVRRELGVGVLLVGNEDQLTAKLKEHSPVPQGLEIVHADSTIGMAESPGTALLRRRNSSIMVAMDLVQGGRASGVVSAGNSGAVMGAAALRLGLLPGVDRPAIAMMMPNRAGAVVLLDGGAVMDCRPEHLRDFARMGSVYAHCLLHRDRPRVGLLSIGTEESKGNALTKKASALLAGEPIDFVGNVEGQQVALGEVDVVVCDGFVGNAILKTTEGYAELFWSMLKEQLDGGLRRRIGGWLLRPALRGIAEKLDYASYGGALLVGVNGICVIGHGRSTPVAVGNAIRVAHELASEGVLEQLRSSLQRDGDRASAAAAVQDVDP